MSYATARKRDANSELNKLYPEDRAVHEWYRFVLSFPPHLVREYLDEFDVGPQQRVLDPFCGTGTVLVECKKLGIPAVGVEANPIAHFASQVKVDWSPDPDGLTAHAHTIAQIAGDRLAAEGIEGSPRIADARNRFHDLRSLPPESERLLLAQSISPLPLHKALTLLDALQHADERYSRHERLALAKALVFSASNLHFGPEVGVGPAKADAPVLAAWLAVVEGMAKDLLAVRGQRETRATVHLADARQLLQGLAPHSIDFVFTSPPYPNDKDYTLTP